MLVGPAGVGKWKAATEYAERQGQVLRVRGSGVTVGDLRELIAWLDTHPLEGRKVGLVDFDSISLAAQGILLKVLEEPPPYGVLVCVASGDVLPTVRSRCHLIRFKMLTEDEVAEVLRGLGRSEWMADQMAKLAVGSVERALEMEKTVEARGKVLALIDAVARHDRIALWGSVQGWDRGHSLLLRQWCIEVLAGRSRVFAAGEMEQAPRIGKRNIIAMLRKLEQGWDPDAAALTGGW